MTNEELVERLRSVAGFDHLPRTDLAVRAADALEASEALEEAASSPIPREALTSGTRAWLRARAAEYRKGESDE